MCQLTSDQKKLNDILSANNLRNVVDFPTRVTRTTCTSLDHVYVDHVTADSTSASAIRTELSDHYAVRAFIPCMARLPSDSTARLARSYTNANRANFVSSVASVDWEEVVQKYVGSPDSLSVSILHILVSKLQICFPLVRYKKTRENRTPWVSNELISLNRLICETKDLINKFPCNVELRNKYDEFSVKYDRVLFKEKSNYYCNIISSSPNVIKTMWEVANTETGKSRKPVDYTERLKRSDGTLFLCKADAVDAMNQHFVGAAATCGAPPADVTAAMRALATAREPAQSSMRLKPFTPMEVFRILRAGVANKKTKDTYDLSIAVLRDAAHPLAYVLSVLYNECRKLGTYPAGLKRVKVSPLYKGKGKQEDINNYRPVSIIPCLAKVFENGLSTRLVEYLTAGEFLSDQQYAYRAGRSTTALARELVRRVLEAREKQLQVAVIFCDLSKAFDVADHSVLASKIKHYGIDGPPLQLLVEFMSGRSQMVFGCGGDVRSKPLTTQIGVAQGSSLSNIMFSLLLNDLPENISDGHVLMYADDVAAIVTASTVDLLETKLNAAAFQLGQWFEFNGLILNVSKTHFMHFNLAGRKYRQLSVEIGKETIEQSDTTKFLGFQLDSGLTWEYHIESLCGRVGRACFALWRVSTILPTQMARSCYFASVHSLLQYGIELYGRASEWERVFRMQKRAVRALVRVPQDTSARPYFRSLKILTLPAMVILQTALYARNNLASLETLGEGNRYTTRNAHKLKAIPRRLTKTSKLVHIMAPSVYNRLPDNIRDTTSTRSFKNKLKLWLIELAPYDLNDM